MRRDPERRGRRWVRWVVVLYVAGILIDLGDHLRIDRTIGDHTITFSDVDVSWEASLFWPVDLLVRAIASLG